MKSLTGLTWVNSGAGNIGLVFVLAMAIPTPLSWTCVLCARL